MDILSPDAPMYFADFAHQIAQRYPSLHYYCVCNEPSLLVELGRRQGRMIIEASRAILDARPDAVLIMPEHWHATDTMPEITRLQCSIRCSVCGIPDSAVVPIW